MPDNIFSNLDEILARQKEADERSKKEHEEILERLNKVESYQNQTKQSSQSTNQNTKNDSGTSRTDGTDNTTYTETITRTPGDKIAIMKEMQTSIQNIYTMIFNDLEVLFYGLV